MSMNRAELQDSARKAFGEDGLAPDFNASWSKLSDMGWFMMTVPEAQGGLGLGTEAAGVIHYELGRALVPGPAIAHMLVIEALAACGKDDLLTRAMGGEIMTTSLSLPGTGDALSAVPDADKASLLLVDHVDYMRIVPLHACKVMRRTTWDESRRLFDVELPGETEGEDLIQGAAAWELSDRLQAQKLHALSADSLGGAEAALLMTIDYLKTRRQFDRPIAMFQALKHRVADLKIAHKAAEALFWNRSAGEPTLAEMGALKAHCTNAYARIAEEAIQLHGGIGLTQEHPCHLFLKRAFLNRALGGDTDHWEELAGRAMMENIR
jgi:alkylation response protein AidB-like acyl-CoA dehydrogenase